MAVQPFREGQFGQFLWVLESLPDSHAMGSEFRALAFLRPRHLEGTAATNVLTKEGGGRSF